MAEVLIDGRTGVPKIERYLDNLLRGIQGEHNSCYLDATLFGLFALSTEFDSLLISPRGGPLGEVATEICSTLRTRIVNPLRL